MLRTCNSGTGDVLHSSGSLSCAHDVTVGRETCYTGSALRVAHNLRRCDATFVGLFVLRTLCNSGAGDVLHLQGSLIAHMM